MSAERFPQMDNPFIPGVPHYSPEHLRYTNGCVPFAGDMASSSDSGSSCRDRRQCLQALGKKALEVTELTKRMGRPAQSSNIQAIPIFRNPPDLQKLGRAVLKLVEYLASEDKSDEAQNAHDERGNDHAA